MKSQTSPWGFFLGSTTELSAENIFIVGLLFYPQQIFLWNNFLQIMVTPWEKAWDGAGLHFLRHKNNHSVSLWGSNRHKITCHGNTNKSGRCESLKGQQKTGTLQLYVATTSLLQCEKKIYISITLYVTEISERHYFFTCSFYLRGFNALR